MKRREINKDCAADLQSPVSYVKSWLRTYESTVKLQTSIESAESFEIECLDTSSDQWIRAF